VIIAGLFVLLALFDVWYTIRQLTRLGPEVELNGFIRWIIPKTSVASGVFTGIMVPTLLLVPLGLRFPSLLVFLLGCRTTLASFQLRVLLNGTK